MKGIFNAIVIPFNDKQEVEYDKLKNIVDYNIEVSQVEGIYVNGSTGENFTIDTETKKKIFKTVKEQVDGRVDLIAQIGSINVKEAVELGKYVKEIGGYKAISAVTPFYYKFSFKDMKKYYEKIITEVDMDMIVYSIPVLTGVSMSLEEFSELFALNRVIGVKFTSNDFYTMEKIRRHFPDMLVYSGFDEMLLSAAVLGIDGAIGSTFNYQGFLAKKLLEEVKAGNIEGAFKTQSQINSTIDIAIEGGVYQTIKAVLTEDGCDAGICNLPFAPIEKGHYEKAKKILAIIK